jgi:hypothetical protein
MKEIAVTTLAAYLILGISVGLAWLCVWLFKIDWTQALIGVVLLNQIQDKCREYYSKKYGNE